jgi:hypothetical protein
MYKIIGSDGKEYGPVPVEQVGRWVAEGRVNAGTRAQGPGSTDWKALSEFPELASLLAPAKPPPIPASLPPRVAAPAGPRLKQGLAVTSFVFGLASLALCLGPLAGLPAIICGHMAHKRAKRAPAEFGGGGFAVAGYALGYTSLVLSLVIAALLIPAMSQKKTTDNRIQCVNNLKQMGVAFRIWATDHEDKFPFNVSTNSGGTLEHCDAGADGFDKNAVRHFKAMTIELVSPRILVCPGDTVRSPAPDFDSLQAGNITYQLRTGAGLSEENGGEILVVCPIHGNSLHCDGSVQQRGGMGLQVKPN